MTKTTTIKALVNPWGDLIITQEEGLLQWWWSIGYVDEDLLAWTTDGQRFLPRNWVLVYSLAGKTNAATQ